jgi:hypothetical protein
VTELPGKLLSGPQIISKVTGFAFVVFYFILDVGGSSGLPGFMASRTGNIDMFPVNLKVSFVMIEF